MKAQGTFILVWICAGLGAVAGSKSGATLSPAGFLAGGLAGGALGVAAGVLGASLFGWIAPPEKRLAILWGVVGLALAAPLALLNLRTPVTSVLACALAGVGALWGVGRARRG